MPETPEYKPGDPFAPIGDPDIDAALAAASEGRPMPEIPDEKGPGFVELLRGRMKAAVEHATALRSRYLALDETMRRQVNEGRRAVHGLVLKMLALGVEPWQAKTFAVEAAEGALARLPRHEGAGIDLGAVALDLILEAADDAVAGRPCADFSGPVHADVDEQITIAWGQIEQQIKAKPRDSVPSDGPGDAP